MRPLTRGPGPARGPIAAGPWPSSLKSSSLRDSREREGPRISSPNHRQPPKDGGHGQNVHYLLSLKCLVDELRSSNHIWLSCYAFVYCSCSDAEFVRNGRCSRALDWSAEAACRDEAGFRVNQTIITHFYVIFTSLLSVMTVIMVLLLHIFATLLRHYYVLIRMVLHHYYL